MDTLEDKVAELRTKFAALETLKSYEVEYTKLLEKCDRLEATRDDLIQMGRVGKLAQIYRELKSDYAYIFELNESLKQDDDTEIRGLLAKDMDDLLQRMNKFLIREKFEGKYDKNNAIIGFEIGYGIRQPQIIEYLVNAYRNFANSQQFDVTVIDSDDKSSVIKIDGLHAYGFFKGEHGVHKFIYDQDGKVRTNYMSVSVEPELADVSFSIPETDLRTEETACGKGNACDNRHKGTPV
jgi:protein subunit release factor A